MSKADTRRKCIYCKQGRIEERTRRDALTGGGSRLWKWLQCNRCGQSFNATSEPLSQDTVKP